MKKIPQAFCHVILVITLLCSLLVSCISDVDFEQAEDLAISPVIESSLLFTEVPGSRFVNSVGVEILSVSDTLAIEILEDDFVQDNLTRAELFFSITNQIPRAFNATIAFLDLDNLPVHQFDVPVAAADPTLVETTHTEIFDEILIDALKSTKKIAIFLSILPGSGTTPLTVNSDETIEIQSKATFFLDVTTE